MTPRQPFHRSVSRWVRASQEQFKHVHAEVIERGVKYAVGYTPVLTGRARASWRVSEGQPRLDHDRRSEFGPNFAAEATAGDLVLAEQIAQARKTTPGVVWITNNVPYAIPLEDGHSKKGRAMLRRTFGRLIAELPLIVDAVKARFPTRIK